MRDIFQLRIIALAILPHFAILMPPVAASQVQPGPPAVPPPAQEVAPAQPIVGDALPEALLRAQQDELDLQRGRGGRRGERSGRGARAGRGRGFAQDIIEERAQRFGQSTLESAVAQRGAAGSGSRDANSPGPDEPFANEAKDAVVVHVWLLIISATKEQRADSRIGDLVARATNLPPVVGTLGDLRAWIGKLEAAGVIERLREVRVMALDGQSGQVFAGETAASITGTTTNMGIRSNNIRQFDIGTQVNVLPHIAKDGALQIRFVYNTSDIEKMPDVVIQEEADGNRVLADRITHRTTNAAVRLKSGTAVVVQSDTSTRAWGQVAAGVRIEMILLGATVVPATD
jgi:hypothetical protein